MNELYEFRLLDIRKNASGIYHAVSTLWKIWSRTLYADNLIEIYETLYPNAFKSQFSAYSIDWVLDNIERWNGTDWVHLTDREISIYRFYVQCIFYGKMPSIESFVGFEEEQSCK